MAGEILSNVMVDAATVPGTERRFWDTSRSIKVGVLPILTAEGGFKI